MAELGWFPRKIGIKVEMSSWRKVCQEVLIWSKANTNMSGQCLMGKLKSCFTCSYCPTSASLSRDSIKSKLFLTRINEERCSIIENIKKCCFPSVTGHWNHFLISTLPLGYIASLQIHSKLSDISYTIKLHKSHSYPILELEIIPKWLLWILKSTHVLLGSQQGRKALAQNVWSPSSHEYSVLEGRTPALCL